MPLFLGLDCGGSSCRAMVIDDTGEPVFLAQGGSANLSTNSETTLRRNLQRALTGAPEVDATCACFAGLVTQERREAALELVRGIVVSRRILVEPDYAAALRACPEGTTACVIAGTGSVICSKVGDHLIKSGGSGYLLGDEGSGFQYGRAALAHYVRHPTESSDNLRSTVLSLFETADPNKIIERVYGTHAPAPLLAGLATAFMKDAQNRREYALAVLHTQSGLLAELTANHIKAHHSEKSDPLIGLAGSLWKRGIFREALIEALLVRLPGARAQKSEMPPVRGAALLAQESA